MVVGGFGGWLGKCLPVPAKSACADPIGNNIAAITLSCDLAINRLPRQRVQDTPLNIQVNQYDLGAVLRPRLASYADKDSHPPYQSTEAPSLQTPRR
jgi:hypothetical protein